MHISDGLEKFRQTCFNYTPRVAPITTVTTGEARLRARLAWMMLQLANKHTGAEPRVCQPKRLTAARYLSVATKMSGRIRENPTN